MPEFRTVTTNVSGTRLVGLNAQGKMCCSATGPDALCPACRAALKASPELPDPWAQGAERQRALAALAVTPEDLAAEADALPEFEPISAHTAAHPPDPWIRREGR